MKKLAYLLVITLLFLNFRPVYAQEQFSTDYSILYKIDSSGEATVTQDIIITNEESDVVVTNYYLTVNYMTIFDVTAETAQKRPLQTEINESNGGTTIKVIFDQNIIGKGKKNHFVINYKTKDLASRVGEIWNVSIPRVTMLPSTNSYDAVLAVPSKFSPEKFVSPQPIEKVEEAEETFYKFNKDSLNDVGITASFGEYQALNFRLKYSLSNDSYFTTTQEIALPPDILNMQQVAYQSINPQPLKLRRDQDGNVLAVYKLQGRERIEITVAGTARILGQQIKPAYGVKREQIPADLIKRYTKEDKYWPVNDPQIQEIATKLYDSNKSAAENAQNAYLFVVNNLKYDFDILSEPYVERKGALGALAEREINNGCMEFTDLFITIVRAMGIPAREINGYAIVNEASNKTPISISLRGGDLLHAWPEFYDTEFGWVQVDPTWGNTSGLDYFTKLDTNHFAFAIKGGDSEFPLPAGTYKLEGDEKQVEVDFSREVNEDDYLIKPQVLSAINYNPLKVLKGESKYLLQNSGKSAFYYNNNGDRITVLPGSMETIHLSKDIKDIRIRDATNKYTTFDIAGITTKKPKSEESKELFYISLALLATGLCMSFLLLIIRPMVRRRSLGRLRRLLPGQGQ